MATKQFKLEQSDQMLLDIEKDIQGMLLGIAIETQDRMITKAPKSSGALRNSIRVAVNGESIVYQEGEFGDDVKNINESILRSSFNTGDTVNIVVGAPYGQKMEQGASDQAPTGFMSSTAEELDAIVAQVESEIMKYRKP